MFLNQKRGQEGITLTTLLLIVLGVIVVVVIILGATGGLNFVFDKVNLAPGQSLEAATQSCKIAAQNSLLSDYCNEFKKIKIAGETQYLNCQAQQIKDVLGGDALSDDRCPGSLNAAESGRKYCIDLIKAGKSDEKIRANGVLCASLRCVEDLSGTIPSDAQAACPTDKSRKLTKGFLEANDRKVCCVA